MNPEAMYTESAYRESGPRFNAEWKKECNMKTIAKRNQTVRITDFIGGNL